MNYRIHNLSVQHVFPHPRSVVIALSRLLKGQSHLSLSSTTVQLRLGHRLPGVNSILRWIWELVSVAGGYCGFQRSIRPKQLEFRFF